MSCKDYVFCSDCPEYTECAAPFPTDEQLDEWKEKQDDCQ